MDSDELRSEIDISMWRFIADVVLRTQAVAQQVGLGGSDCQFVALLGVHGPLTAGRLAELSGLTTGTVTGVIDRLEKAGYARRVRDATDRRKVLVPRCPKRWRPSQSITGLTASISTPCCAAGTQLSCG